MKFHVVWIVWLLACISIVLCQDGIGINNATKSSILSEVSKQNFEATTSQKPTLTNREEQIEDELSNSATTTEKFVEKQKFILKSVKDNEESTTIKIFLNSTKRSKILSSTSLKKSDELEDVSDGGSEIEFTTSFDGLTKKSPFENGERKTKQRSDGWRGVTTNRGKTKFQIESETSEVPEILSTLRHKKPIRVKPMDQNVKEELALTSTIDDTIDTTTIINNSEIEQQKPKFKKPSLIATHYAHFGTSTEPSRRPAIRQNFNLKQKISSSTIKTKPSETESIEPPEHIIPSNKTVEVISSNTQSNKIRPIKVIAPKVTVAQQPIPPTAIAWALASLKAPNNSSRVFRKPLNVTTNTIEQISKIKPFVTWSTRLQKINEENSNTTSTSNSTLVTEPSEVSTEVPTKHASSESDSASRIKPEIIHTSTESLIHISTLSTGVVQNTNDSSVNVVGGDTDQNKYEIYGSQKPEVENSTTVIETLRPSTSTTPSESQSSNLLLVTSYKSIFENDNSSEIQTNGHTSPGTPMLEDTQIIRKSSDIPLSENIHTFHVGSEAENVQNKEITKDQFVIISTEKSDIFQNSENTSTAENIKDHELPVIQTSTETFSKIPEFLFDYSDERGNSKTPSSMMEVSTSDGISSFSHDIDLRKESISSTTEQYIDSIKTKLDDKVISSTENHDSIEMVDFINSFTSEQPISSTTDRTDNTSTILEKTTSELPMPSNEISNSSQVPNLYNSSDTSLPDFEFNSTENHDDTGNDGQKSFESSSQTSTAANEPTLESDISENDVPLVTNSSTSSTSTTSSTTTSSTTTTPTTTTSTTTTLRPIVTTTIMTTQRPTATTTVIPMTTSTTTTTTTTTTPKPTTTTTTTTTTEKTTTFTPPPPVIIETTTPTTTTIKPKPSTALPPTTTTWKPNSITLRPKPAIIVDLSSTTSSPDVSINLPYLKVLINSTMKDVCESKDELKAAIIKLFESGIDGILTENQIQFLNVNENDCSNANDKKIPAAVDFYLIDNNGDFNDYINEEFFNLLDNHQFDYKSNVIKVEFMNQVIEEVNQVNHNDDASKSRVEIAIYLSCVALVCTLIVLILVIVRKRQKRFNYGQRCTPVSLDDYSMDNISVYNSVRRKGALRASKRSYGNPAFEDSSAVSHSLNFAGLASFSEDRPAIDEEFTNIPVITVKPDELPPGAETKNRYANVIPMPETRVTLNPRGSGQNSDYINANFVKGHKGADKFYIACQAPMQSTLPDFWQMIWEQNTRVIIMLTSLTEKGVEKCADYLPPSEVLDCHRLFGDFQVTLKKREVKDKFIISSLQLKNLDTNLWRDVWHLWYGGWPAQGVPSDPGALLSFLMEARSHMKTNNGPHVVHCSPGTGRTGTVIACDIAVREFELSRTVDVPKTVYAVRRCRAGAVQTRDQYALVYKVVNLYASKLSGGVLDSI